MGQYFRIRKETNEVFLNVLREVRFMTRAQVDIFFKSLADYSDLSINDVLRVLKASNKITISEDGRLIRFRYFDNKHELPEPSMLKTVYILLDYVRNTKDINTVRCIHNNLSIISEGQEYTFIHMSMDNLESNLNYYSKKYNSVRERLLSSGRYEPNSPEVKTIDGTYIFIFDSNVNRDIAENVLNTFCKDIPYNAIFLESDDIYEYMTYDIVDNEEEFLNAM